MKVTKYPQSCLLIEKKGHRIVIDPGSFFIEKYSIDELGQVDAVLYTHQHRDHYDADLAKQLKSIGAVLYGNTDVCALIDDGANEVTNGQTFEIAGFSITPHDLPHFVIEGREMPQNTGYIIDGNFFHPGDGIKTSGFEVNDLATPIAGAFTFDDTLDLAHTLSAKRLIPIHYSNQQMYPVNINEFIKKASAEFEVIVLEDGQTAEL